MPDDGECLGCGRPWEQEEAKPNTHGCKADDRSKNTICPKCGWCAVCDEIKKPTVVPTDEHGHGEFERFDA